MGSSNVKHLNFVAEIRVSTDPKNSHSNSWVNCLSEVHWSQVPGRDEKWKQETISNTSERQFTQEFECEFLGSVDTLISATNFRMPK